MIATAGSVMFQIMGTMAVSKGIQYVVLVVQGGQQLTGVICSDDGFETWHSDNADDDATKNDQLRLDFGFPDV